LRDIHPHTNVAITSVKKNGRKFAYRIIQFKVFKSNF